MEPLNELKKIIENLRDENKELKNKLQKYENIQGDDKRDEVKNKNEGIYFHVEQNEIWKLDISNFFDCQFNPFISNKICLVNINDPRSDCYKNIHNTCMYIENIQHVYICSPLGELYGEQEEDTIIMHKTIYYNDEFKSFEWEGFGYVINFYQSFPTATYFLEAINFARQFKSIQVLIFPFIKSDEYIQIGSKIIREFMSKNKKTFNYIAFYISHDEMDDITDLLLKKYQIPKFDDKNHNSSYFY